MGQENSKDDLGADEREIDVEKRKEDNKKVIKAGFKISLDRIRATLQYETTSELLANGDATTDDLANDFEQRDYEKLRRRIEMRRNKLILEIESLHCQVFTAAGSYKFRILSFSIANIYF